MVFFQTYANSKVVGELDGGGHGGLGALHHVHDGVALEGGQALKGEKLRSLFKLQ